MSLQPHPGGVPGAPLSPLIASPPQPPPPSASPWTFTQGLLLGQLSFILLTLLFMRYVVFSPESASSASSSSASASSSIGGRSQAAQERRARFEARRASRAKLSTTSPPPPLPSELLGKVEYDMSSHGLEGVGWGNVLVGQVISGYRGDLLRDQGEEGARRRVEGWLNPGLGAVAPVPGSGGSEDRKLEGEVGSGAAGGTSSSASWLDPIEVTGISLGTGYPLLSNARIRPADARGNIRAEIDLDYTDTVSLSLSTSVLINFPRPRFAVLPVSIGVELVSFGGTLSVSVHNPTNERQHMHVCLLPDFHLNLKTTSLLGSRAKLQDIPKLEQLILARLRHIITTRLVHPAHLTLALPRMISSTSTSSLSSPRPSSPNPLAPSSLPRLHTSGPSASYSSPAPGSPNSASTLNGASSAGPSGSTRMGVRQVGGRQSQPTADTVIADFGDAAVEAMGDAVREGWGRMVRDLSGVGAAFGGLTEVGGGSAGGGLGSGSTLGGSGSTRGTASERPGGLEMSSRSTTATTAGAQQRAAVSTTGTGQADPRQTQPGVTKRKITMPAGFPHSGSGSGPVAGTGAGAGVGMGTAPLSPGLMSPGPVGGTGGWTSALQPSSSLSTNQLARGPVSPGLGGMAAPVSKAGAGGRPRNTGQMSTQDEERFRFQGHFSSQPSTPAVSGYAGLGGGAEGGEKKRGALNSAAASRGQYAP